MPLVERWGADTMRLTMLFAGPFEDDIDWKLIASHPDRRPGVNAWLGRVFGAVGEAVGARDAPEPEPCGALTHRTIRGVTRGHGAIPVQHGHLEADGADERDARGARRGRWGAGGGERPRA